MSLLVRRSSDPSQLSSPKMHMISPHPQNLAPPETPLKKSMTRSLSSSICETPKDKEENAESNSIVSTPSKPGHFRSKTRFQGRFEVSDIDHLQLQLDDSEEKNRVLGRFQVSDLGNSPPKSEDQNLRKRMHSVDNAELSNALSSNHLKTVPISSVVGRFEVVDIQSSPPQLNPPPLFSESPSRMISSQSLPDLAGASNSNMIIHSDSRKTMMENLSTTELMLELTRRMQNVLEENAELKKEIISLKKQLALSKKD
jgi:hypothetical protein